MKPTKLILLLIFSIPFVVQGQFGPKKKDLQNKIDSLKTVLDEQRTTIIRLNQSDSLTKFTIKKLNGEMKDLNQLIIDLHSEIQKIREDNARITAENKNLNLLFEKLTTQVQDHEILIKNVIGEDSLAPIENEVKEKIEEKEEANKDEKSELNALNFAEFANDFISTVKSEGEFGLKPYLDEDRTFYYLSKPGFMVSVAKINDANELSEEIPWKMALDAFKKSKFRFIEGEKPSINCEMADLYDKTGCYGGLEQNFSKISKSLTSLKEFSPDEFLTSDENINQVKSSEKNIMSFIYSTDGNIGFYFIKKEGEWLLYCVDVDDPCSA